MSSTPVRTEPQGGGTDRPLGSLVKHSAIYSAAPVLQRLVTIGLTRLYTGWLGTSGSGVRDIVDLWLIALQQLLGQNLLSAMVRFYFDRRSPEERGRVVTSCILLVTGTAFVVCAALLGVSKELTPLLFAKGEVVSDAELVLICRLLLVIVPFQLGTISGLYYLQALRRSGSYTGIQTLKFTFELILSLVLVGSLDMGVRGFLLSMLAGEVLTSTALCGWILVSLRPRIDWQLLRPILAYSAPLIPVGLLQLALHQMDRRIVLEFLGQSGAGIYGLGYKISYLVTNMVLGPFILTWQPWIFGVEDPAERARLVARVSTYAVMAVAVTSLGVILFGRQAVLLLAGTPTFHEAYKVVPFVATGYVFWALYNVSQTPLFLDKRTGRLVLVNLIAVVLNVSLNYALIPCYGIVGAATATLVTFAVLAGMGMLASRSFAGVHFEIGRLAAILAAVTLGGAAALWTDLYEDAGRVGVGLALALKCAVLVVLVLGLWLAVLAPAERARFMDWSRGRLRR